MSQEEDLDLLVVECMDRVEREGPAALDAICAEHPALAAELRAAVARRADTVLDGLVHGLDQAAKLADVEIYPALLAVIGFA